MLNLYTLHDIITTNPKDQYYYVGRFENIENPDVKWPHRHSFYSLVLFTDSTGINVIDFEEYIIKPNRIFLMQPKQVHNWSYSKKSEGFSLVFDKHLLDEKLLTIFSVPYLDLTSQTIKALTPLFENLANESLKKDKLAEDVVISGIAYLLNQLKRIIQQHEQPQKIKSKTALKFSKLIAETIDKPISVGEYADMLGVGQENLIEICKKNYGQNPKAIILDKKITEAKRYLYFTEFSIKEIAFKLGFEDSSYFSRLFKNKTKLSPSKFKSTR